ncbi:MAG: sugar-binding protein [Planctomycetota bacterium]|jgi:hypothetical protein
MLAKKCLFVGIFTLLSLSLAIAAPPAEHPATGESLVIELVRGTPDAIDGDLSDWDLAAITPAVLDTVEQMSPEPPDGAAAWDDSDDCSGEFYLLWDDVNIYMAVVVKDDSLSMNKSDGEIWNADCIEVFFSTTNAVAGDAEHYQYGFNANNQTWNWCNMDSGGQSAIDYLQVASTQTADGYICEASIEHGRMLSLDFSGGSTIGFHPVLDDTDNGDRELQITWTGREAHDQSQGFGHIFLFTPVSSGPSPADGALLTEFPSAMLGTTLRWRPGPFADTHDVYFGDDFDDVNDGTGDTFQGNQTEDFFIVGFGFTSNDPLPDGLEPGMTYYWRIDDVNETNPNSPWKGTVWSFSLPPVTARDPKPADGAVDVSADPVLSWTEGLGAIMYTPYFGENFNDVNNATGGTAGPSTSFTPDGPLEVGTTYYWRVDVGGVYGQFKGEIWSFTTIEGGTGRILREVWTGIGGTSIGDLTGNARYPDDPDISEYITIFDGPVDWTDNYGTRIHGWLYVPVSGDYTFWIAGDDNTVLYLSSDIDPTNKQLIANVPEWTNHLEWTKFTEQQSAAIPLVGGEKYYIEALQKEGGGGDSISASWRGPASPIQSVIAGEFLCPTPYDPIRAYAPNPGDGSTTAPPEPTLTWLPGKHAESHELYFGTDYDAVTNATTTSTEYVGPRALGNESYAPGKLEWEGTYYWRVDEISNTHPDSPWKGTTWTFTTTNYLVVDDFEDYNTTDKQIWAIWHDGIGYWDLDGLFHPGNGTGSGVGDEENDVTYMEESAVHSGSMSMPYFYNNNDPAKMKYSEAKLTLKNPPPRDWTEGGIKALSLWFQGYPDSVGSFTDNFDGTYTMTASGYDIWTNADGEELDEFHFAYKPLNGAGSIIARVDSVEDTDPWAKAGVMIRDGGHTR